MEYIGIDYVNKTPVENVNMLFNSICIELVKRNEFLYQKVKELTKKHIEIMINQTHESDEFRPCLFELEPTWKAMKNELTKIEMLK